MKYSSSAFSVRVRILSSLFVCAALLLSLRLYFVQIVHGGEYQKKARGQYEEISEKRNDRNDIFFSKKEGDLVAAAVMQAGWVLAIVPAEISNPEEVFDKLSAITSLDRKRFFASVAKVGDPHEDIGFRIGNSVAERIRKEKIPGVILVPDQWRSYPGGALAAHAIGFVGYKGDARVGVYGLERFYEDSLAKKSDLYVNPFAEIFANVGAALSVNPAENQGSIITSIEPQVQARMEETLSGVLKTYSSKLAAGIVMNPHTGEIIALAIRPTFDPNTYGSVDDPSLFTNILVENIYEMGSIMKPLTVAAGIDADAITPNTTYNDKGCIERSGKKICNYDGKARGLVGMQEVLNQSLNLGATFIADTMEHKVFSNYIRLFKFGEKTDVDLPSEALGSIDAIDGGYDIDYASASFGQGISMTGVGMIRGLASLANGGLLPSPHIVKGIRLESGIVRSIAPAQSVKVLKPETVQTVSEMLVKVFDTALLGGILKQDHYSIAAKTGTAQIAIQGGGGYYNDRFLHSFFGYFPAHDPKFIIFLMTIEPHGAEFASATLARPFLDITKFLINYYDIAPDR